MCMSNGARTSRSNLSVTVAVTVAVTMAVTVAATVAVAVTAHLKVKLERGAVLALGSASLRRRVGLLLA